MARVVDTDVAHNGQIDYFAFVLYIVVNDMKAKRLLWLGLIAFAVFFVIEAPAEAARLVRVTGETAGDWFGVAAESLTRFVKNLV